MGKYSDIAFGNNPPEPYKPGKYSSMAFGGPKKKNYIENPYMQDTAEISTITGKPIQKPSNTDYTPADFTTIFKAGFVDNEDSVKKLYAQSRGIPVEKYEVKDGTVWFEGNDGNMYPEVPKEALNLVKKLIAELPSEGLADIGAATGAILGGVPGAAIGAGTGEGGRKLLGELFFGDEQTAMDYAKDMGVQAVFGTVDASLANKLTKSLSSRKIKKTTGGKISKDFTDVVGDLSPEQRANGQIVNQKAQNIGVDLKPHQAMDDPTLTGYYSMLRDNPKTARTVRKSDNQLDTEVQSAGEDLIKNISNKETDPFTVGDELSKAGTQAIEKMKKVRGDAVKGLYDKAGETNNVDIQPVLNEIGRLKKTVKPGMKAHPTLNRLEKMLTVKDGKDILPENRLKVIDDVKQEIDLILGGPVTPKLKRKLMGIKDVLTTQTDQVSEDYRIARALYSAASPKINNVEKGITGVLSRMTTDEIKEKAVQKIFASRQSIKQAKKNIEKVNPELWKDAVAELFRDGFEKASKVAQGSGGKVLNRPGKYTSKMWDLSMQKKLKVATEGMKDANGNPLHDRIVDFFDVMQKASIGQGKESATQSRLKMEKELQGLAGQLSASAMNLRQAVVNFGLKNTQDRAFDKNAKKLLELMQTPEGVDLIATAKGYGAKTEKGMIAATTLLLMATETNAGKINEIKKTYQGQQSQP